MGKQIIELYIKYGLDPIHYKNMTNDLFRLFNVSGSLPVDEHLKFAEWCISNGVTTYYNEDDSERFIDNDKEIFFDISQIYEKFKRQ